MGMQNTLLITLIALLVVVVVARLLGTLFKSLGQPPVIGEVLGGILLGPSFLRGLFPEFAEIILPAEAFPFLSILAQIGVLLYMFVIGLELDLGEIRQSTRAALTIAFASITVPFILGFSLAYWIPHEKPGDVSFLGYAIFLGVALSVTAFPVLARILSDFGIQKTKLGILALTCAAIGDAAAWCLLALSVGVLQDTYTKAALTIVLTAAFVVVMLTVVKKIFAKMVPAFERASEHISETSLAIVLICLLIAAVATELIGTHAIFGGFLLGAIIPHKSRVAEDLDGRLKDLVRVLFMPAFFAYTGMRTELGLLGSPEDIGLLALVVALATAGKFGGSYAAARFSGLSSKDSAVLGSLMNTRGLVELIVLNVGMDLGVLSPRLFTILVFMALLTTFATGPSLRLLGIRASSKLG
jgi:Kef-type K+ transport system membrane component KefB